MTTEPVQETTAEPIPDTDAGGEGRGGKRRLAVAVLSLVAAILVAELAMWLSDQPRFARAHSFPPQFMLVGNPDSDGWIRHVNKPSESIRFVYESDPRDYFGPGHTVTHTTNSLGFRGGEFPLGESRGGHIEPLGERNRDVLRIVFLGDSVTFGEGVHDVDTFVERIAERLGSSLNLKVELYNFGVGGHNASDALWTWQHYARHLDPDLVVYTFVLNDAEQRLFRLDPASDQPVRIPRSIELRQARWSGPPEGWWSGSRLARLAWKSWAAGQLNSATLEYYRELNASYSADWTRCKGELQALQQIDPTLAVVVFPMLYDLAAHPFRPVHLEVANVCESVEVIDLWEPLAQRAGGDTRGLWVHPSDTHPNEIAHAVAARAIADRLQTLLRNPPMALFSVR